jgi:hypothetical protein
VFGFPTMVEGRLWCLWEVWLVADKIGEKLEQRSGCVRLDWLE